MKVILRNTQTMLGDRLMFTPAVRDLKLTCLDWRINVISAGPEVWLNNPHLDRAVSEYNCDHLFDIGPAKVTHSSKTNGLHAAQAFADSLQRQLFDAGLIDRPLEAGPIKADLHLSQAEKDHRIIDGRYWVINIDTGPMSAKRWPAESFQEVVSARPEITFVQVGMSAHNRGRLHGSNVIDMIDRTKIRELFSLVYNADGCISLVSSLMHVAGAFDKPCVVLAGGREPDTFERYPNHRFIDTVGMLACCRKTACWHNALSACEDHDGRHARCMRIIQPHQVTDAILSYYEGGALEKPPTIIPAIRKPLLRIVSTARYLGGAERSVAEIAHQFDQRGWLVEFATPSDSFSSDVRAALPKSTRITSHVSRPCDVLLLYASDMVYNFDQAKFDVFQRSDAKRKVMALTYKLGKVIGVRWAHDWDQYLFLSTALRDVFVERGGAEKRTAVLAPPIRLEPFLKNHPDYGAPLTIGRHSSQGDKKYPLSLAGIIESTPNAVYRFMPGASWMAQSDRVKMHPYDPSAASVAGFLQTVNCFWYLLPEGYTDQGPRVIVEAMAAGLAVIAENRDGAADRVTPETGWLVNQHDEAIKIIQSLNPEILQAKGQAARDRARSEFDPARWFEAICGQRG